MAWWRQHFGKLQARLLAQLTRRTPSETAFLLLLPVVGLVVGLASVSIAHFIDSLQRQFWGGGESFLEGMAGNPRPLLLIIPVLGGLVVGLIGWLFKVETRGGGTAGIIQAVALKGGLISLRKTIPRVGAAIITLATGGSLGREGPMAMLASAIGSRLGRQFKLSPQHLRILVCAAAASALAAVYNAPIGGSLFALEILMGNFALEVLGPVVVASMISTLVFRSCMGNLPRFVIPRYELVSVWELPAYLVLGVIGGLVSVLFIKALFGATDLFEKLRVPRWVKPAIGATLLAGIGLWLPHVFGNGFETVNMTLREELPLKLLLILPLAKLIATALSYGSGGAGGLFTPSLMIGALVGGVFGHGVHTLFPQHTAEYGAYALVGMGAIVAGTTHGPLTAIMMIFEQTNSYQIVLPLMFVCIVSHYTARGLRGRSIEDEALARAGVTLPRGPEAGVMQTMRVSEIMHPEVDAVPRDAPFAKVVEWFLKSQSNWLYVVDDDGGFLGAISMHGIKDMLHQAEALDVVVAADIMNEKFDFVTPHDRLADVMDKFWEQSCERMPVLENSINRKLIGWMSKRDLLGVYSQEILQKRQLLGHFVVNDDGEQHDAFVELPEGFELRTVELPVSCAGKTLAQLAPRSAHGVHVMAIKHRHPVTGQEVVELPGAQRQLNAGDRLVVIGTFENIAAFMAALATDLASTES
jgi:CIC family chloride channel protein